MGISSILVILFLSNLQYSIGQNVESPPPPDALTECGQTIVADNGTIQYKLNETYDAGEFCVFVIQFPSGGIRAKFYLESEGFSDFDPNALLVSKLYLFPQLEGVNLGPSRRNTTIQAYGAVIYFRTNSSLGTGFKLSFERESTFDDEWIPGLNVVFNDETASPLHIPLTSYNTSDYYYTNFFFTSGSKMITEPSSYFKLTTSVTSAGNQCDSWDDGGFLLLTFEQETPVLEQRLCYDFEIESRTRGIFMVHFTHLPDRPPVNGTLKWEFISAP